MRIWTAICIESSDVNTIYGNKTLVLYIAENEMKINAKTRAGAAKSLLRDKVQVFGACAPVNKTVANMIRRLNGKELSQETIDWLTKRNKKYTPFRYSRDYQLIIEWLILELNGRRIDHSAFRTEKRAGRINDSSTG